MTENILKIEQGEESSSEKLIEEFSFFELCKSLSGKNFEEKIGPISCYFEGVTKKIKSSFKKDFSFEKEIPFFKEKIKEIRKLYSLIEETIKSETNHLKNRVKTKDQDIIGEDKSIFEAIYSDEQILLSIEKMDDFLLSKRDLLFKEDIISFHKELGASICFLLRDLKEMKKKKRIIKLYSNILEYLQNFFVTSDQKLDRLIKIE